MAKEKLKRFKSFISPEKFKEKKVKFKPKKLKPIKRRRAVDVFARVKPQRTESAEEFLFG